MCVFERGKEREMVYERVIFPPPALVKFDLMVNSFVFWILLEEEDNDGRERKENR